MFFTLFWTIWFCATPLNYVTVRINYHLSTGEKWTRMDRMALLFFALFGGPILLVSQLVYLLVSQIAKTDWAKREAKW